MTFIADTLLPIGKFRVGAGSDYPVLAKTRMTERVRAVDGASSAAIREVNWSIISVAQAADRDSRGALQETIRGQLCVRGQQVQLWEFNGAARSLPAQGGASGSVRGFPRVDVEFLEEWQGWLSSQTWQLFKVDVTAEIPVAYTTTNGYHIAESWQTIETSNDRGNNETQRVTGYVRTAANENAGTYVADYIIANARSAAVSNELDMVDRRTVSVDQAQCNYEYTISPRGANSWSFGDVTAARVSDVTTEQRPGFARRVVSGYAEGIGATSFAEGHEPTPDTNELLVSKEVSEPDQPDGRVTFRYEIRRGVAYDGLPGLIVFSLNESISEEPGDPSVQVARFAEGAPILWRSGQDVWRYVIATDVEFAGAWSGFAITPPSGWADNKDGGQRVTFGPAEAGIRRARASQAYVFTTQQTLPTPREIPAP